MMSHGRTYIIAEAGINHNGSLDIAKRLIDIAAKAGADAVKFQTFKAERLVNRLAPKAEYQARTTDSSESQYEMLRKLELSEESHLLLMGYCRGKGIQFLSTPFDLESVDLLTRKLVLPCLKLPSGEITNAPLLLKAARTGRPIILSTGMSTLSEIKTALGVLAFGYTGHVGKPSIAAFEEAYGSERGQRSLKKNVTLLHCTSEYPTPFTDVNLRAMDTMRDAFGLPVGLSDHTPGIAISIAAVALGAVVIEKHFTLDRNMTGPDHKASLEPGELEAMVQSIRQVEAALGSGLKVPAQSEVKNLLVARKSLVATKDIKKGEPFTEQNLGVKRPGSGVAPVKYWEWLGKLADRDYKQDEVVGL